MEDIDKAKMIAGVISLHYNMELKDIFKKTRKRFIVQKRQTVHHFCCLFTKLSYQAIGDLFTPENPIDHATVIHSNKTIENLKQVDKPFSREYSELKRKIESKILKENKKRNHSLIDLRIKVIRACRISKNADILKQELINLI